MRRRTLLAAAGAAAVSGCLEFPGGWTDPTDRSPRDGSIAFRDVTDESGFEYRYASEHEGDVDMISNAGVFATDYDNDGWVDLLALGGREPVLFRNTGGAFERSDALPSIDETVHTALFFDHNNNGWDDLLLLPMDAEAVFLENREGRFERTEVGLEVELDVPISAAAADFTGNGSPDVFVIQNGNWNEGHPEGYRRYLEEGEDNGYPNLLFAGDGSSFTDVTEEAGIWGERWSLATSFVDLTGDDLPDIHVANDFNYDVLYLNRGDGTFDRVELGPRTDRNAMSSEVADFDGDGRLDIFVTNIYLPDRVKETARDTMQTRTHGNNLLLNRGDGVFEDRAEEFGVRKGGWGWAAVAVDFDNDGRLDLFHAASSLDLYGRGDMTADEVGEIYDRHPFYRYPPIWEGTEDGFVALDPDATGLEKMDSRGVAMLDFTNDGSADLAVADADGEYKLYENVGATGKAVQVDVRGTETTTALGAKVTVSAGSTNLLHVADSKSDFLAQSSRVLHFGVADHDAVDVTVRWPDGTERTFEDVATQRRITVSPDGIEDALDLS